MPTYTTEFHTDAEWAMLDIKAPTPEKALAKARRIDPDTLDFEPYGDRQPVNYITIRNKDGNDLAEWQDDELRLEKAMPEILEVAENIIGLWEEDISIPYEMLDKLKRAIAKSKGGAA
jgi:hypothetical protein